MKAPHITHARTTSALLYLSGVTVSFDGFRALNNLSLLIEPGEMRAIIGPNGAGKTTMMDVITGKTRPDEGEVVFDGTADLTRLDEADIAQLLRETTATPHAGEHESVDSLRLSIAGAQEKTALLRHRGQWLLPQGSTPTTHILKLPLGLVGNMRADMRTSVENEWLCTRIIAAYGLPVAPCEITHFEDVKAKGGKVAGQPIRDLVTVNGVRVTCEDGSWGLVRASSNKPELVVVVESPVSEQRMRDMFEAMDSVLRTHPEVGEYNQKI